MRKEQKNRLNKETNVIAALTSQASRQNVKNGLLETKTTTENTSHISKEITANCVTCRPLSTHIEIHDSHQIMARMGGQLLLLRKYL